MQLAQIDLQNLGQNNTNFGSLTTLTLPAIVSGLIRGSLVVAAVVFFFILVIGGIRWIASGGDKAATEGARNQITAALIGLVIVFAAWAIVQLIQVFFGVNIFSLSLPTATQ
jgi:hypothetical protein